MIDNVSFKTNDEGEKLINWFKREGAMLRLAESIPKTIDEWQHRKRILREELFKSFGEVHQCAEPPDIVHCGSVSGDGFDVENILIQTRPSVHMTANLYLPHGIKPGEKLPAILKVHGHSKTGRLDPKNIGICNVLVRQGYIVLTVDAFGAGERRFKENPYHGDIIGASLWPVGDRLLGLQVYENMRAIDYLISRSDVDPDRIGCTGASGGGNQTMYVAAFDERIKAAVPVVSVGTYLSYIYSVNCVCETLIDGLTYAEEWEVLGLVAPRALLVINSSNDAVCFSAQEASKSISKAKSIYKLSGKEEALAHLVVDSPHGYNKLMREPMYGWFNKWLKGAESFAPLDEPEFELIGEEELRCFPENSRPKDFTTIPRYVSMLGSIARDRADKRTPQSLDEWAMTSIQLRERLRSVLKLKPDLLEEVSLDLKESRGSVKVPLHLEGGLITELLITAPAGSNKSEHINLILSPKGKADAIASKYWSDALYKREYAATIDLRWTGELTWKRDARGSTPHHNSPRAALWLGKTLMGIWVDDVLRAVKALKSNTKKISIVGIGYMGLVAIIAGALDMTISSVVAENFLSSYSRGGSFLGQSMGIMVPDILTKVGDVPHIASLIAPRELSLFHALDSEGKILDKEELLSEFSFTMDIYKLMGEEKSILLK